MCLNSMARQNTMLTNAKLVNRPASTNSPGFSTPMPSATHPTQMMSAWMADMIANSSQRPKYSCVAVMFSKPSLSTSSLKMAISMKQPIQMARLQ